MHILQKNLMVLSQVLRTVLLDEDGDTIQASIFLLMSSQLTSTTAIGPGSPLPKLPLPVEIGERANVIGYPVGRSVAASDQEMGDDDGVDDGDDGDSSCCCSERDANMAGEKQADEILMYWRLIVGGLQSVNS